jgi:hypothetical protein
MIHYLLLFIFLFVSGLQTLAQLDFTPVTAVSDRLSPYRQTINDFDNNGLKDIAYTTYSGGFYVLYNQGNKVFTELSLNIAKGVSPLESGDFNEDGKADIVIVDNGDSGNQRIAVLISSGTNFEVKRLSLSIYSETMQVLDFNKDSHLDILITPEDGSFTLLTGDGKGNFAKSTLDDLPAGNLRSVTSDLNKDGLLDFIIVANNQLDIYLKNSAAGYTKKNKSKEGYSLELISADFSDDGYPDLVATWNTITNGQSAFSVEYFINDGLGGLNDSQKIDPSLTPFVRGLASMDYDKDGRQDLLVGASANSGLKVLHNNGNNNFTDASPNYHMSKAITDIDLADLDNDGTAEIIELSLNKNINIYSYANSTFGIYHRIITGPSAFVGKIVDLNKDGNVDLVSASVLNGCVSIHYGGTTGFKDAQNIKGISEVYAVETGDFNSDGFDDIVFSTQNFTGGPNEISLLLSDANGILSQKKSVDFNGSYILAVADFNQDGKLDFSSGYAIHLGDGGGNFTTKPFSTPTFCYNISAGHLNQDSYPDLAFGDGVNIYVALNDGGANFATFSKYQSARKFSRAKMVKFDSDNLMDFIAISDDAKSAVILKNKNNLQFDEVSASITEGALFGSADVSDFNLDGLVDIVAGISTTGPVLGAAVFLQDIQGNFTLSNKIHSETIKNNYSVPDYIIAGDLNKDGKKDIIGLSLNAAPIWIALNDMVIAPTSIATSLTITQLSDNSASLSLQKGNGKGRLVAIAKGSSVQSMPIDGHFYASNAKWEIGNDLGNKTFVLAANDLTGFEITGLQEGVQYSLAVFEYNINSKNTIIDYLQTNYATLTFTTKKTQIITFNTISERTFGDPDFQVPVASNSGLAASLEVIFGNAVVTGLTISLKGPGPVKLKASQIGNNEYVAAAPKEVTFCVNPSKPLIAIENVSPGNFVLTSSSDKNNQWLFNEQFISNASGKTYSPTENGVYAVKVDYDGCSNTSLPTSNLITGLERNSYELLVYPNPVKDFLFIKWPDANPSVQGIILSDALGKKSQIDFQRESESLSIDLRSASEGMYSLIIKAGDKTISQRILKQN